MNFRKYSFGYLFKDCKTNRELLRLIVFIKNKPIGANFAEKKKFHKEFEENKLLRASQIKNYLQKSIKCKCGKPALIQANDPYDIELDIKPFSVLYSCE